MRNEKVPAVSQKELLILKMLLAKRREMYGLELVDDSNGHLKRGTVYVTLMRMEEKGFVESRKEATDSSESAIPRRLYKVTALGQRVFHASQVFARTVSGKLSPIGA